MSLRVVTTLLFLAAGLFGQINQAFSFEDNMEGWESDALMPNAVPCNPLPTVGTYPECRAVPGKVVDQLAAIRRTQEQAFDGTHSVKFTLDGDRGPSGTAWIIHPFPAVPGTRYRVRLRYYIYPLVQGAVNPYARIAYAGPRRPVPALGAQGPPVTDFGTAGEGGLNLANDWAQFDYVNEVVADDSATIWVGLGLWVTDDVSDTYYFDNVTVTIDPIVTAVSTAVVGMSPNAGSGQSHGFAFVFSDSNGWQDIGVVNILVNDTLNPAHACYLAYAPAINVLYLVSDAGTALLPGFGPGSAPGMPLTNSQCSVDPPHISWNGDVLVMALAVNFSSSFSGNRTFYLAARDVRGGNNTGWQTAGTWTVP